MPTVVLDDFCSSLSPIPALSVAGELSLSDVAWMGVHLRDSRFCLMAETYRGKQEQKLGLHRDPLLLEYINCWFSSCASRFYMESFYSGRILSF